MLFNVSNPAAAPQHLVLVLLGIFVFILAFAKTNAALSILIISMLLSPEIGVGRLSDRAVVIRIDDILLIIIFLGWLAKLAVFKELGLLKRTPLNGPIFGYIFVCVVSTALMLIGGQGKLSRSFFYFLKYFEYFLVYFLVVNNIENMRQARYFVFLLIATGLVVGLYALYSYFGGDQRATAPFEGKGGGEPNTLAGYLVLLISVVLGLLFYSDESLKLKIGLTAVLAVSLATLVFTLSRSGWLSFAVMYLAFIVINKRSKIILVIGFILAVAIGPVILPKVVHERVEETFRKGGKTYQVGEKAITVDESGAARIDSWKVGMGMIMKKPILGYGIPGGSVVDNQYTRVLTETGFMGFLFFLFLLWRIFRLIREGVVYSHGNNFACGLTTGLLAGFFGLLSHSFTAATFILIRIMEPFWFLMAITVILPDILESADRKDQVIAGT